MPNQPYHDTAIKTDSTSFVNCPPIESELQLPMSLEYARQVAERSHLPHLPHPCQLSCDASPISTGLVEEVKDQIQEDLRSFARWPRLRDPTLPPPIVGRIETDPSGVADRYGVKGKSAFTAFVNMDNLRCWVCAFGAKTLQLALLHQERARHFQP